MAAGVVLWGAGGAFGQTAARFSIENMDLSVDPGADFYSYATGMWVKENPPPADKSSWTSFDLVEQRNWQSMKEILETNANPTNRAKTNVIARLVGDFYASAMDTNRLEKLAFKPLAKDFSAVDGVHSINGLMKLLARLKTEGASGGAFFSATIDADEKNTSIYSLALSQGGLGLPDRDYYFGDSFAKERDGYLAFIEKLETLSGVKKEKAQANAKVILAIETDLAKASRKSEDLRDPVANYHKVKLADLEKERPGLHVKTFIAESGRPDLAELVVRQPEFLEALEKMFKERPLDELKTYLHWHVLRGAADYLNAKAEQESFAFYGTMLNGQPQQEPRWQRAGKVVDSEIGEALGKLYVEKYFPAQAKKRMDELVSNLRAVFNDRLKKVDWMTEATRAKAAAKFARFTSKIGHPDKFRDYSSVKILREDFLGNVRRASAFETKRNWARVGKSVDRSEWIMTPPTVNAYFNPPFNEIVFPAGILQPPFFDMNADDAVNYGAIGFVIGHEITHGFDDEGRQFDADGNLNDWWAEADAKEFTKRATKLVDQYSGYEGLPGMKVNGKLTLGENIADLGGLSIAYEALQRALAKDPSKRKLIDGFTPEQRFFLSAAQVWRANIRDESMKQSLTGNPHSPPRFRVQGPMSNLPEFYEAFPMKPGARMWRQPEERTKIW